MTIGNAPLDYATIGRRARALSMLMTLLAGIFHVAMLWQYPLSADTLLEAGRGVILLLLAMGLMGTARLSLILVIIFCASSLFMATAPSNSAQLMTITEVALVVLAIIALFLPSTNKRG